MQRIKMILLLIYSLPTTFYFLISLFFDAHKTIKKAKNNNEPTINVTEILINFMNRVDENREKIIHINGIIWILIVLLIFK
jgi:hypothetical protein